MKLPRNKVDVEPVNKRVIYDPSGTKVHGKVFFANGFLSFLLPRVFRGPLPVHLCCWNCWHFLTTVFLREFMNRGLWREKDKNSCRRLFYVAQVLFLPSSRSSLPQVGLGFGLLCIRLATTRFN